MDLALIMIGGFAVGFLSFYHPLDRLRRALWHARIEYLKTELSRPRGDGGGLRETALKLGPAAIPLLTEQLELWGATPIPGGIDLVDVLLEIVGLEGVPDNSSRYRLAINIRPSFRTLRVSTRGCTMDPCRES